MQLTRPSLTSSGQSGCRYQIHILVHVTKATDWTFTWLFFDCGGKEGDILTYMIASQELVDVRGSDQFLFNHPHPIMSRTRQILLWWHCLPIPHFLPSHVFYFHDHLSQLDVFHLCPVVSPPPDYSASTFFFLLCQVTLFYFTPVFQASPPWWSLSGIFFVCVCTWLIFFWMCIWLIKVGWFLRLFPPVI